MCYLMTEEQQNLTALNRVAVARGSEVRRAREVLGISQAELADRAGTSQQTVDRIERGIVEHSRAYPSVRKALGLEVYDVADVEAKASVMPPRGAHIEGRAASLVAEGRIPVLATGKEHRLVDAIPRAFPYEFVEGANALLISSPDMEPVLRPGDIVVVNPHVHPMIGSEVAYHSKGTFYVRTLIADEVDAWVVQSWNPVEVTRIPKAKIDFPDVVVAKFSRNR